MGAVSVVRRPVDATRTADNTGRERREYYDVVWDSIGADPGAVAAAPGLPQRWESHPQEPDLYAQSITPRCNPSAPTRWEVEVVYRAVSSRTIETQHPDPLERPPLYEWDAEVEYESPLYDFDGKLIRNTAGDQFDPVPQVPQVIPVLRVTRNERTFSVLRMVQYAWTVNADPFYGVPSGYALMLPWRAQRIIDGRLEYWQVTYTVKFRDPSRPHNTWHLEILNTGRRVRDGNTLKDIWVDATGALCNPDDPGAYRPSVPSLLNATGTGLGDPLAPVVLKFRTLRSMKFSQLSL